MYLYSAFLLLSSKTTLPINVFSGANGSFSYTAKYFLFLLENELPLYKDDMTVVCRTVHTLAEQTEAKRIVLVMAWESRTPDREERTELIRQRYADKFLYLLFPVHIIFC